MANQLNTTVDSPIVDIRDFSSVLRANPLVKNHWSAIQKKAYRDPANNFWKIPARKGGVPLSAYDNNVGWQARGPHQVPTFLNTTGSQGRFNAVIPNPGNLISILTCSMHTSSANEMWALNWASDASFIWYAPYRTSTQRTMNNGAHIDFGTPGPQSQWNVDACVIDLTTNSLAVSTNGGAFTVGTPSIPLSPKADATLTLMFGQGTPSQPFHQGSISDLMVFAGDIRAYPLLLSQFVEYNQTAYAA